ncbi:M23 family metallopeptidase [Breznakiellaceae bacterium SP9]
MSFASWCNIPPETLATLNRFPNPDAFTNAKLILLPTARGLFLPEYPASDFEKLLDSGRQEDESIMISIAWGTGEERFRFIPGAEFSPTERSFFLNPGFHFPLKAYRVSSTYGPRINPVTGKFRIHQGVDLAAPMGTDVYAAKSGTVSQVGYDAIFGNFIIIKHDDTWVSLYGHLSKIETAVQKKVSAGALIGKVGTTGQSTGPHLHFELRQNGKAQDPSRFLRLFQ